jgi:hypothetical protein
MKDIQELASKKSAMNWIGCSGISPLHPNELDITYS